MSGRGNDRRSARGLFVWSEELEAEPAGGDAGWSGIASGAQAEGEPALRGDQRRRRSAPDLSTRLLQAGALALDKTTDVSLGPIDEILYARSSYTTSLWDGSRPIDTFVHVYHGPVHYEDISGRVDRQEHWFDPNAGPRAWFTKKMCFGTQSEYRFAVSTLGDPVAPKHNITVSPELRELTMAL